MKQIRFSLSTFYTREYFKYDSMWMIEDLKSVLSTDSENNPIQIVKIVLNRNTRNYLYTLPSYIIYILTLLMFWLPQTSNQRIIIGSTSLIIATLLIYIMSINMSHTDLAAWPVLGKFKI